MAQFLNLLPPETILTGYYTQQALIPSVSPAKQPEAWGVKTFAQGQGCSSAGEHLPRVTPVACDRAQSLAGGCRVYVSERYMLLSPSWVLSQNSVSILLPKLVPETPW